MTNTYQILESNIYKSIEQSKNKSELELIKKGKYYLDITTFKLYDEYILYSVTIDVSKDDIHNYYIFYLLQLIQIDHNNKQILKTGKIFLQNHILSPDKLTDDKTKNSTIDITNMSLSGHINSNLFLKCSKNGEYDTLDFSKFTTYELLDIYYEKLILKEEYISKLTVLLNVIYTYKNYASVFNKIGIKKEIFENLIKSSFALKCLFNIINNIESNIDKTDVNGYIDNTIKLLNLKSLKETEELIKNTIPENLIDIHQLNPYYLNLTTYHKKMIPLICNEIKKCIINDYINHYISETNKAYYEYLKTNNITYGLYNINYIYEHTINPIFDNFKSDILSNYDFIYDLQEYKQIFYIQDTDYYTSVLYCIKLKDELQEDNTYKTFVDNIRQRDECKLLGVPKLGCNNTDFMFTLLYYVLNYIDFKYPLYIFDASNFNTKNLPYKHCINNTYRSVLYYSVLNVPTFYNKYGFKNDYSSEKIDLISIYNICDYLSRIVENLSKIIKNKEDINKVLNLNTYWYVINEWFINTYRDKLIKNYMIYYKKDEMDSTITSYIDNIRYANLILELERYSRYFNHIKKIIINISLTDTFNKDVFETILRSIKFIYQIYFIMYNNTSIKDNILLNKTRLSNEKKYDCVVFRFFFDNFLHIIYTLYDGYINYDNHILKNFLSINSYIIRQRVDHYKSFISKTNCYKIYSFKVINYFITTDINPEIPLKMDSPDYVLFNKIRTNLVGGSLNEKYNSLLLKYNLKN